MEEEFDIEKFLDENLVMTPEEQDFIKNNLEVLQNDEHYQYLERRFYYELKGFDLDIEALEIGINPFAKNKEERLKILRQQRQELINLYGFIFNYAEE